MIIVVAVVAGGGSGDGPAPAGNDNAAPKEEQVIEYTAYSVGQLVDDLETNAMKAAELYDDQYVELTGELNIIDSSGSYFSIAPMGEAFALTDVICYFQNEEQKQVIMNASVGDPLIVKGKITDVGEILGYYLDVDSIEVQ